MVLFLLCVAAAVGKGWGEAMSHVQLESDKEDRRLNMKNQLIHRRRQSKTETAAPTPTTPAPTPRVQDNAKKYGTVGEGKVCPMLEARECTGPLLHADDTKRSQSSCLQMCAAFNASCCSLDNYYKNSLSAARFLFKCNAHGSLDISGKVQQHHWTQTSYGKFSNYYACLTPLCPTWVDNLVCNDFEAIEAETQMQQAECQSWCESLYGEVCCRFVPMSGNTGSCFAHPTWSMKEVSPMGQNKSCLMNTPEPTTTTTTGTLGPPPKPHPMICNSKKRHPSHFCCAHEEWMLQKDNAAWTICINGDQIVKHFGNDGEKTERECKKANYRVHKLTCSDVNDYLRTKYVVKDWSTYNCSAAPAELKQLLDFVDYHCCHSQYGGVNVCREHLSNPCQNHDLFVVNGATGRTSGGGGKWGTATKSSIKCKLGADYFRPKWGDNHQEPTFQSVHCSMEKDGFKWSNSPHWKPAETMIKGCCQDDKACCGDGQETCYPWPEVPSTLSALVSVTSRSLTFSCSLLLWQVFFFVAF